jgi:hypothetical protein
MPVALEKLYYNTTTQQYVVNTAVPPQEECNGFEVVNDGTSDVYLNGKPIHANGSQTVGGNYGEIYVGRIDLQFFAPVEGVPPYVNSAWVTQKFYTKRNFDK